MSKSHDKLCAKITGALRSESATFSVLIGNNLDYEVDAGKLGDGSGYIRIIGDSEFTFIFESFSEMSRFSNKLQTLIEDIERQKNDSNM